MNIPEITYSLSRRGIFYQKLIIATFTKVSYDTFGRYGGAGQCAFVQYRILTRKKKDDFETSTSPNFELQNDGLNFPITIGFGPRYQKPVKSFILRTRISIPKTMHFRLRLSF